MPDDERANGSEPPPGLRGPVHGGFCIFGERIAPALEGRRVFGGAELQLALLARILARHGVSVTVIDPLISAPGDPAPHLHLETIVDWNRGPKGLRLFLWRIPGLLRALRATGASVFYARGVSFFHLLPLHVAHRIGSKFVLGVASDSDVMGFRERYRTAFKGKASLWIWLSTIIPNEIAYRFILRGADAVIVQHRGQMIRLRARGLRAIRMNNILDEDLLDFPSPETRGCSIVLVGAISQRKGLRLLLPVIRRLQGTTFEFIGEATDMEGAEIVSMLRALPNVVLHGQLERRATIDKIASAHALLNASPLEGFPNTFIEAWALRTPVISLSVDPEGMIRGSRLGYVCDGDLDALERLLALDSYDLDLDRIRQYAIRNHASELAWGILGSI